MGKISTLHGNMQLDITAGCMSGTTAAAAYDTLLSGLIFVIDYFTYIGKPELQECIRMGQMSAKLVEGYFGKLTERTQEKHPRIGDMARRPSNCAFTHMLGHITTKGQKSILVSVLKVRGLQQKKHSCTPLIKLKTIKESFVSYLAFDMKSCSLSMTCTDSSLTSGEKELPSVNKILYIGNFDGRQRITDMYKKRASKEEIFALNAVVKH